MKDSVYFRVGRMFGLQSGFVVGFMAGFGFALFAGAISGFGLQWQSIAYAIDKFSTPLTTITASGIATYGVYLAITNEDRLAEEARKNRLIATRISLLAALVDLENICKDYTLLACHGSKYKPKIDSLDLSDSNKKVISLMIENSRQRHQISLGNLFTFFHIAVSMYEDYIKDKKYIVVLDGEMSGRLKNLIVHFISLRSLIQCYYLYGMDGNFDNFEPDITDAYDKFNKMIETFEEYNDHKTPTLKEEELKEYARQGKSDNIGFLKENYVDNLIRNIKEFRKWRDSTVQL